MKKFFAGLAIWLAASVCAFAQTGQPTGGVSSLSTSPCIIGGPITATGTLQTNCPFDPQGRITLTSNTPVMTATVTGATAVIYTSYKGRMVPVFDGTNMLPQTLCAANTVGACELTLTLGSNWAANAAYDLFGTIDTGTFKLCSVVWTNTTTRATALAQLNGLPTNGASATCRTTNSATITMAVNQGTYLGSFYTNGSTGQVDYIFGAAASGGTASSLGICNYYQRVYISTTVTDSGTTYTYTTGTTRQARASAGNQIKFIVCQPEDAVSLSLHAEVSLVAAIGSLAQMGFGLDATNAFSPNRNGCQDTAAQAQLCEINQSPLWKPGIGVHTVSRNEKGDGTNANTFDNNAEDFLTVGIWN